MFGSSFTASSHRKKAQNLHKKWCLPYPLWSRDLLIALPYPCTILSETWGSLQKETPTTLWNETFAGEYRRTNRGHACPTDNHFVRAGLELLLYKALQTSPSYRPAQLPRQHHPDQAQTQQSGTDRMMQLRRGWYVLQKAT